MHTLGFQLLSIEIIKKPFRACWWIQDLGFGENDILDLYCRTNILDLFESNINDLVLQTTLSH